MNIDDITEEMIRLLQEGGSENWARTIEAINYRFKGEDYSKSIEIITLYGGMGSLNDVVLYRNGKPLIEKNNRFQDLKSILYQVCSGVGAGRF